MKLSVLLSILITLAASSGCLIHRPEKEPSPLVEARGAYDAAPPSREPPAALPQAPWWTTFADPRLDRLIGEALASNLDLRAFAARVAEARAFVRRAGGRLLPALDVTADYASTWESSDDHDEAAAAGLDLRWEIDLWGRLRAGKRAAEMDALAARWDWIGARLLLSASVAETYFLILAELQQLALLEDQIDVNDTLLELTRLRFGQGQASVVDVLQQREQLASTRSLVPEAEARLAELEYALDVLLGAPPGERERLSAAPISPPPALPALGLPADLLQSRPDLLAARHRVVALDYRVGEAIADRLPRLEIGGALAGAGRPGIDTLLATAFAGAIAPLYDGGTRRAEVDIRRARLEESLSDYSRAFLTAWQEVETALVQEEKQAERVSRLEEQLAVAQQLLVETRNRYSQGLTDYLPVLEAVGTVQDLERDLITNRRRHLALRVALHRALGGPMPPARSIPALADEAAS